MAGAVSKTIASCIAYPHEVARTRLREEGNKYNTFWQTLHTVWKEEGRAGLYRYAISIYYNIYIYMESQYVYSSCLACKALPKSSPIQNWDFIYVSSEIS